MSFSEKRLEDLSKRIEQASKGNKILRQQLTQLQVEYRVAQENRDYVRENYKEKVKELKSDTLLTTVLTEKLYSEEMDIKQLQADLAAIVRGNDILKYEVKNTLDTFSYATPKLKYLELQNLHLRSLCCCLKLMLKFSFLTAMHQNSTCGAAENVGTAAKPNGIMHEPVRANRPNVFSSNSSSVLSCIQAAVDIPSQSAGPSTFELPYHAIVGPRRKGGVRVGESPTLLGSELSVFLYGLDQSSPHVLSFGVELGPISFLYTINHLFLHWKRTKQLLRMFSTLRGSEKESNWLGATTSAAVIILGVPDLFLEFISGLLLTHANSFSSIINYAVVASVLLGAAVPRHLSVTDPLAARRDALQSTVILLREGFRRKDQNSFASSSEGCGSSVKYSSSADTGHLGNATVPGTGDGSTWNNIEGINSDKGIDSGRPSLAPRTSSYRSVVQEPEVGSSYVDRNLEDNSSLVVCSSSGLESQSSDSSTSTSANQ
ncbi:Calpain-type cysteine protease DEK1 [Capsicum baccatum]|uniref:Calpain-type cysteine protease DEK1 n=1 Tax=Capsicum baccatum TaxID=33114 RepID=A0A2G2VJV7_CAPBA|nr:Calpain-type cysteine protease DEK1 [Capsicum baccatum]